MATPLCPYFGSCGGCAFQHVDYAVQLGQKKNTLSHAIRFQDISVFSDEPYGYRERMDFIVEKGTIGLRKKGKWDSLVDVNACVISNSTINSLLKEVREHFALKLPILNQKNALTYVITAPECAIRLSPITQS